MERLSKGCVKRDCQTGCYSNCGNCREEKPNPRKTKISKYQFQTGVKRDKKQYYNLCKESDETKGGEKHRKCRFKCELVPVSNYVHFLFFFTSTTSGTSSDSSCDRTIQLVKKQSRTGAQEKKPLERKHM